MKKREVIKIIKNTHLDWDKLRNSNNNKLTKKEIIKGAYTLLEFKKLLIERINNENLTRLFNRRRN